MLYYFVNQSSGPLFIDIVNEFARNNFHVKLYSGQIHEVSRKLNNNIELKLLKKYNRNTSMSKFLSWLIFTLQMYFNILFTKDKSTWLLCSNPPFSAWLVPLLKIKKNKVFFLIYDLYPEILEATSFISSKNLLYFFWYKLNALSYKHCIKIISIGESMNRKLCKNYAPLNNNFTIIPNWNVISFNSQNKKNNNNFVLERNAFDKIHIVYSGNLGATHDFETLLKVALQLNNDEKFIFSIIGNGSKYDFISKYIKENKLKNTKLMNLKPANEVEDVYLSADIFFVSLGSGAEQASIPSKTFDALAAGAVLLVISPRGSELELIVNQGNTGRCFLPGDSKGVISFLVELALNKDLLLEMQRNSFTLSKKYSRENVKKYLKIMTS